MKLLWLLGLLVLTAVLPPTRVDAKPNLVSQYSRLTGCKIVAQGDLNRGQDWGFFRCKGLGGIPAWYICQDSARCKLGFGDKPNASLTLEAKKFLSWPIEWRGTIQQGRLTPFAVIVRGRWAGAERTATTLFVYRIRLDGTSCLVGEASTNEAARRIADKAADDYKCESEPELL